MNSFKRSRVLVFALVVLILAFFSPTTMARDDLKVLRVSAIPTENPTELIRMYKPFSDYLSKQIGMPVQMVPALNYAAVVDGFCAGKVDLAFFGGFTSVMADHRCGLKRLVCRKEDLAFHSVFITLKGSGIKSLKDLKGKTFAFGDPGSTSGHLMPRFFLMKNGLIPERDFKQVAFTGTHDATAMWIQSGKVDAGALDALVWKKLVDTGKVDKSKVVVFYTTPPFVDYNWAVNSEVPPALIAKIRHAFLRLNYENPSDRVILDLQSTRGFIPAPRGAWKMVEKAGIAAGLLKGGSSQAVR